MPTTLIPRSNNFDLLRLLFAVTVFLTHLYELSGYVILRTTPRSLSWIFLNSGRAVQGFFVISGFLIFMSYERSSSVRQYLEKRIRRLYPCYLSNILLSAVLLGAISTLPLVHYFSNRDFFRFVGFNAFFLNAWQWTLPGVFETHRFTAVNGALWTLQIEVLFYIAVPIIALLGRFLGKMPVLIGLYILSATFWWYFNAIGQPATALLFPGQLCFFVAGSILYCSFDYFSRHRYTAMALAVVACILQLFLPLSFLYPFTLAVIVIFIACFLPFLGHASRFGDLSYSIYIYHFPIIQFLIEILPHNPLLLLLSSYVLVPAFALASWHFVEKRFLLQSSHYLSRKTVS